MLKLGLWPQRPSLKQRLSKAYLGSSSLWLYPEAPISYSPLSRADDHSCTDMSGILLASCMAGTTMLLLSCRSRAVEESRAGVGGIKGWWQGQRGPHL